MQINGNIEVKKFHIGRKHYELFEQKPNWIYIFLVPMPNRESRLVMLTDTQMNFQLN